MRTNHPFIRVHVNGDTNYTDLISKLLGMGLTISIPLDEVSNIEANAARVAVAEVWHDGAVETRKARINRQRAEADQFIAERDEREAKWRQRDEWRAAKAAEREMFRDVDSTTVECRTCGALVGAGCHKASGEMAQAPHVWRVRAAAGSQGSLMDQRPTWQREDNAGTIGIVLFVIALLWMSMHPANDPAGTPTEHKCYYEAGYERC